MGSDFIEEHRGAPLESWAAPFRKAFSLRGRPESRLKWYFICARRFAVFLPGSSFHLASREDAERFLSMLASSPGISAWQVEQAADALTILLGSVFGQEWARTIRIPDALPPTDIPLPKGDEPAERLRYAIRCRPYSVHTEVSRVFWGNRFLAFCRDGGVEQDADAVRAFLERLVIAEQMSAATQAQALNALAFHFWHVVGTPFGDLGEFQRSKRPRKVPVVLIREEVRRLRDAVEASYRLPVALLYGGGLRLMEAMRLRVKDIDLDRRQISVRDGKGQKDRVTVLPERWRERLTAHLAEVRKIHAQDLELCYAGTIFWPALERKYPGAPREWAWQYILPASRLYVEPATGKARRHHLHETVLRRAGRTSRNPSDATRCGNPLLPTCWSLARTSARCRSSSVTATSRRR